MTKSPRSSIETDGEELDQPVAPVVISLPDRLPEASYICARMECVARSSQTITERLLNEVAVLETSCGPASDELTVTGALSDRQRRSSSPSTTGRRSRRRRDRDFNGSGPR